MYLEEFGVGTLRVLVSLSVLRWAYVGGWAVILIDMADYHMVNLLSLVGLSLDLPGISNYQVFDKALDQVYMIVFLIVALRWQTTARSVALSLFLFRLVGILIFAVTGFRVVLLVFPNVFELWFLFVASLPHWRPQFTFSRRNVTLALIPITVLKEIQEFALHGYWFHGSSAFGMLEATINWAAARFPVEVRQKVGIADDLC